MEKLDFLIDYILNENTEIKVNNIPKNELEKKRLYRSLCNIYVFYIIFSNVRRVIERFIKIKHENFNVLYV